MYSRCNLIVCAVQVGLWEASLRVFEQMRGVYDETDQDLFHTNANDDDNDNDTDTDTADTTAADTGPNLGGANNVQSVQSVSSVQKSMQSVVHRVKGVAQAQHKIYPCRKSRIADLRVSVKAYGHAIAAAAQGKR